MKVPRHIVDARRNRLASLLEQHRYLPIKELCDRLGISEATARRDLAALVAEGRIKRTYGGALTEFDERFPSFTERRELAAAAKAKIAKTALSQIRSGGTYFFDTGTTIFALAEALRDNPVPGVNIVTSNLPVVEMLAAAEDMQIFLTAGQVYPRQAVLLGEIARKSLQFWNFDGAFLSAEGMTAEGLWNTSEGIVAQQRAILAQARRAFFCVDGTKLKKAAQVLLVPWNQVDYLVTDATPAALSKANVDLGDRLLVAGKTGQVIPPLDQTDEEPLEDVPVYIL